MALELFGTTEESAAVYFTPTEVRQISLAFWARLDEAPEPGMSMRVARASYALGGALAMYLTTASASPAPAAKIGLRKAGTPGIDCLFSAGSVIGDGDYHHFAAIVSAGVGAPRLWIDGVEIDQDSASGTDAALTSATIMGLGVGMNYGPTRVALDGRIAEVATWSTELSQSQIDRLAAGAPASLVRPDDLLAYMPLYSDIREYLLGVETDDPAFDVAGAVETEITSASATHTVSLPGSRSGEGTILLIGSVNSSTITDLDGYTAYAQDSTTGGHFAVLAKLNPSAGDTVATIGLAGASTGAWHAYWVQKGGISAYNLMTATPAAGLVAPEVNLRNPTRIIKFSALRTRRTDNTLVLDGDYTEQLNSVSAVASALTSEGRLVSGYREAEWDCSVLETTGTSTGTLDAQLAVNFFVPIAFPESGRSGASLPVDHPVTVAAYDPGTPARAYIVESDDQGRQEQKDSDATLDYWWHWHSWLDENEFIETFDVSAPAGITLTLERCDGVRVSCWLSGGTNGITYPVTCRVTTNHGRTEDRTIQVLCLDQ